MYKGIVFHNMQLRAFLSIAAQEGLICENGITDGVYDELTKYHPSYMFAQNILEQFCVAGTVYMDSAIFRCFDGELIDKGIIKPYEKEGFTWNGEIEYDVDMVQTMLVEKGYDIKYYSVQKITEEFNKLQEQLRRLISIEDKYPDISRYEFLRALDLNEFDGKYTRDIFDNYHTLKLNIFRNPIYDICVEYLRIASIAYQNDLLSTVSIGKGNTCKYRFNLDGSSLKESDNAVTISQYTSDRLGTIITAGSLKDCITLISTSEAIAYREKVDEFINYLARSDFNNMEIVDREIKKAQNAMRFKKAISASGKIVATAGAIVTLAGKLTPDPLLDAMGIAIATVGIPVAFYDPTKKYIWASYGINK